ncbi:MAG: TonB-dependent receptor domain-containing protein, partial [Candidatus Dormibacteraceae bacterium]
ALSPFRGGQPLIRVPRNSASYNLTWRHGRLMLNTNASFRGSILDLEPNDGTYACQLGLPCLFTAKGYNLLNGGFSYQLPKGFEIYGRLYNLLNQSYEETLGFPALKLNFMAGLKFTFPAK